MTDQQGLNEHERKNLALWEGSSDSYQERHQDTLSGERVMAWGVWRIPEAELQVLSDVRGKDVLELGCGAAQWSIALAREGARPTGVDLSPRQLEHARRLMAEAGVGFPLVQASAESVPLPDESFDVVFCDWGAMTFSDPYRAVPEAARMLRPGGLFAFCTANPIYSLCTDTHEDRLLDRLVNDYFTLHRLEWEDEVDFQLPFGAWIRLFRRNRLVVEDLIEPRAPEGATSTYRDEEEHAWSRRWPAEAIWKLRKEPSQTEQLKA